MFIPLKDRNPLRIIPLQGVTIGIIVACVVTFGWQLGLNERSLYALHVSYGMIPTVLLNETVLPPALSPIPAELTMVSSLFLHGNVLHLLGNMLFLWIFGDNVEDSMGHGRFAVFYLLCGAAAALTHAIVEAGSNEPLIGASGAISGVLGAYLMLHPHVKVLVLIIFPFTLHLPAYLLIGGWLAVDVYNAATATDTAVAWWAHIGGFVAGALLVMPFRREGVPLFDRGVAH